MAHYVAGFMLRGDQVALIRKNKPDYLAGCLNGIGGGVERGETAKAAMRREFEEEAGVNTLFSDWTRFATINTTRGDRIDFFCAKWWPPFHQELVSKTDELVGWYSSEEWPDSNPYINLNWLIPMAQTAIRFRFNPEEYRGDFTPLAIQELESY